VKDPGKEFPIIRLMGTFGWIFINNVIGSMKWEDKVGQFWVTMAAAVVMVVISLTLLPHMPPKAKGLSRGRILGASSRRIALA